MTQTGGREQAGGCLVGAHVLVVYGPQLVVIGVWVMAAMLVVTCSGQCALSWPGDMHASTCDRVIWDCNDAFAHH